MIDIFLSTLERTGGRDPRKESMHAMADGKLLPWARINEVLRR